MIEKLLNILKNESTNIYIQTHNFPDPDAVASAYGLQQLLENRGIHSDIIYDGVIQRRALNCMIEDFSIPIRQSDACRPKDEDKIIIVDGSSRNSNVTDLPGKEIAVIDHHPVPEPDGIPFVDIRPEAGACSSIIASYYLELGLPIPADAATILLTGLFRDTDSMTRGVSPLDVAAYGALFKTADYRKMSSMVLNNITLDDLQHYDYLINNVKMEGSLAFCYLKEGCNQNLLGILGDFLLSLQEIRFTALFAANGKTVNLSFRNESEKINASDLMKKTVSGIGTGGGHRQMAGGVIYDADDFDERALFKKISHFING